MSGSTFWKTTFPTIRFMTAAIRASAAGHARRRSVWARMTGQADGPGRRASNAVSTHVKGFSSDYLGCLLLGAATFLLPRQGFALRVSNYTGSRPASQFPPGSVEDEYPVFVFGRSLE